MSVLISGICFVGINRLESFQPTLGVGVKLGLIVMEGVILKEEVTDIVAVDVTDVLEVIEGLTDKEGVALAV